MTKKNFDKFDSIAASKEKMEKWGIEPEELGWDGEEEENVEELEDGGDDEEDLSWEEMKANPEIADKFYDDVKPEDPTEEEMLENAGGKWKKEKSQADKIGEAVAKHINQPHQEETEELEEAPEPQETDTSNKDLPPEWKDKLAQQGGNWIEEEELSQGEEDSILSEVKENTEVEELKNGKKRIDTTSIRAIAELNSLNYSHPNMVNILHTDNENERMTAIVDPKIKEKLN